MQPPRLPADLLAIMTRGVSCIVASRDAVVAVRFQPEQAFDQTPGPRAGVALELGHECSGAHVAA